VANKLFPFSIPALSAKKPSDLNYSETRLSQYPQ
jgi:hypothetical protein